MLNIDGSFGEGGGQILRTALALSLVTGKSFRIENIRANRKRPGLLRQHLTAVQAAAAIGKASIVGAAFGSGQLTFIPGGVQAGEYRFDVGSAGSATLVLQTILPAFMTAKSSSTLTLEGGTHNPYAPPFDFLEKAFLPIVNRMGPAIRSMLERPGFYPAGGGKFQVTIQPAEKLTSVSLLERGGIRRQNAKAVTAKLPRHIAERQLETIQKKLSWPRDCLEIEEIRDSRGPGNIVMLEIESEHITEVFTSFGARGLRAELVAEKAAGDTRRYLAAGVPVGEHLADQLLIPFALAGGGSFMTLPLSRHARTNIEIVRQFLDVRVMAKQVAEAAWVVNVT